MTDDAEANRLFLHDLDCLLDESGEEGTTPMAAAAAAAALAPPPISPANHHAHPQRAELVRPVVVSHHLVEIWRACLPRVVLDHEGAQFEWWKHQPGFERTLREMVKDDDSFVLHINLGIFLYGTGKFFLAQQHFRAMTCSVSESQDALLQRWIGRSHMKEGEPRLAQERMRVALDYFTQQLKAADPRHGRRLLQLEVSLSYSDLAWVWHDWANTADASGDAEMHYKLAVAALQHFSHAIDVREQANSGGDAPDDHDGNLDSLRLLADDYYGKMIMLIQFKDSVEEAQLALQRAEEFTLQVYGGRDDCESDVMSRIHRGRGVLEIKRARECDAAATATTATKYEHFDKSVVHLERALQIRTRVMGERHSQVANLKSLLAEVKNLQWEILCRPPPQNQDQDDGVVVLALEADVIRLRREAVSIWDANLVAQDHTWRKLPRELSAGYFPRNVTESVRKAGRFGYGGRA